jgi:hypothetical protein
MVNIGDYADAMNATLEIDSKPGHGTMLKLVIPFVAPADDSTVLERSHESNSEPIGESGEQTSAA